MESPVAAIEFGYPVRFGVAWTEVTACRAKIVTGATALIRNLMSLPLLPARLRVRGGPQ
jgi:hypothetical protein